MGKRADGSGRVGGLQAQSWLCGLLRSPCKCRLTRTERKGMVNQSSTTSVSRGYTETGRTTGRTSVDKLALSERQRNKGFGMYGSLASIFPPTNQYFRLVFIANLWEPCSFRCQRAVLATNRADAILCFRLSILGLGGAI